MNSAMWNWIAKVLDFGGMALCVYLAWRLLDKWAGKFLDAQRAQTEALMQQAVATASLAASVKDGQENGREVLIAVRLLADRIEMQKDYLIRIDDQLQSVKLEASRRIA